MRLVARLMRWTGMAGAFLMCLIAILLGFLRWGKEPDTGSLPGQDVIGWELRDLDPDEGTGVLMHFILYAQWPLTTVVVMLALTVGVRARWGRFLAAMPPALVVVLLIYSGLFLWQRAGEDAYIYGPEQGTRLRMFAVAFIALAVPVLAAVGLLIARQHASYDAFVVVMIAGTGILELVGVGWLTASGIITPYLVAWLVGPVHLLSAVLATVATVGAHRGRRIQRPPDSPDSGQPVPGAPPYPPRPAVPYHGRIGAA